MTLFIAGILIGILILVGIWYTANKIFEAKSSDVARETEAIRRRSLESAALKKALEEKEKDLREALEAADSPDPSDGADFLLNSFD